ncbi:hypothetical protein CAC42_7318 [Sphaceloma murrayae]|uniref:Fibronectin type-III domain-containing protein n=1 Tax=Sphaceloma murrayae TaxID=2082308 RepID=A0A2K1QWP3_9PEZI|nr:hypothetical protein CAC42_7318 [Sphaceloma murrayae]
MAFPINTTEPHWLTLSELLPDPSTRPGFLITQIVLALDAVWIFLGSFSSLACVAASAAWLIYRVARVAFKPLDELVTHLGFDVPQGPRIDLAAVRADGVTLHWKPADDRKTSTRYEVQINGMTRGKVSQVESSLVISNLIPDHNYVFRIVAINSHDFKAASEPIRVRTKPAISNDFYGSAQAAAEPRDGATLPPGPIITPFKTLPDSLASPTSAPLMARETSNGPSTIKRTIMPRRPSPATFINEMHATSAEDFLASPGLEGTQQQLTERLEEIGKEIAEAERQILEEEQESEQNKNEHTKERDDLRAALKEKDNASKDLRKKVSAAERENTAMQNRKAAHERQLQQKISEKQKVKDDTERWIHETKEMHTYVEDCGTKKVGLLADLEQEKQELQVRIDEELQTLRQLEDEVKDKLQEVKKLEREKSSSPASGDDQQDYHTEQDEEDRVFEEHMAHMEEEYRQSHMQLEEAKLFCDAAFRSMQEAYERSRQLAFMHGPPPLPLAPVSRANSARQRRGPSDQYITSPTGSIGFPMATNAPFSNGMNIPVSHEPFGPSPSPFFNINNGTAVGDRGDMGMSSLEIERLTGGAPMSPSAGADLIPADLLSNADEEPISRGLGPPPVLSNDPRQGSNEGILPGLGAFSSSNMLPGLGVSNVTNQDLHNQGPQSPVSGGSRSPSVFASPQASASNLAFHSPEQHIDTDGRSIRSGRSIRPASGTGPPASRFAQILGLDKFNRQRGKTWTDDGLALGKLQSQSMPKDVGLDEPSSNKRRNSSHSGNFFGTFKAGFGTSKAAEETDEDIQKDDTPRRRPFMGLGGKDGWGVFGNENNRPVSPRPGSTHSSELPRPSEARASWSFWPSSEPHANRQSPLGAEWISGPSLPQPQQPRTWGSRYPSRRPSAQVGTSGGGTYDIQEDEDDDESTHSARPPQQAPIGTRPSAPIGAPVERPVTPSGAQLNPAAKDFKSLFAFGDSKKEKPDKPEKSSKPKKSLDTSSALGTPDPNQLTPISSTHSPFLGAQDDMSPPQSRKSRDSRSVMTAESSTNDASSIRASLDRTPSHQLNEVPTPTSSVAGSVGKGSLMQRLSRKSSSGKFALPVFQKKRQGREGPVEEGGEEMTASVGSLGEDRDREKERDKDKDKEKRTWSSGFGLGFGKGKGKVKEEGKEAGSVSEASLVSGEEDR